MSSGASARVSYAASRGYTLSNSSIFPLASLRDSSIFPRSRRLVKILSAGGQVPTQILAPASASDFAIANPNPPSSATPATSARLPVRSILSMRLISRFVLIFTRGQRLATAVRKGYFAKRATQETSVDEFHWCLAALAVDGRRRRRPGAGHNCGEVAALHRSRCADSRGLHGRNRRRGAARCTYRACAPESARAGKPLARPLCYGVRAPGRARHRRHRTGALCFWANG